jgi:hypothetical protein
MVIVRPKDPFQAKFAKAGNQINFVLVLTIKCQQRSIEFCKIVDGAFTTGKNNNQIAATPQEDTDSCILRGPIGSRTIMLVPFPNSLMQQIVPP